MGTTDEHWCTLCQRKLDKKKDRYLDFELIHQAAKPLIKKWKKPKGLICMECVEKDPKLKAVVDSILAAGNPAFVATVFCHSFSVCQTYQPSSKPNVNCGHIAVSGDTVYCKRSHPGSLKLMVERAERLKLERKGAAQLLKRAFRNLPEPARQAAESMFAQALGDVWFPPSAVIKAVPVDDQDDTNRGVRLKIISQEISETQK